MSVHKLAKQLEIRFWDLFTPIIGEKGPLMKTIAMFQNIFKTSHIARIVLVIVWAAVGFVSGLLLGKIIMIFQLL